MKRTLFLFGLSIITFLAFSTVVKQNSILLPGSGENIIQDTGIPVKLQLEQTTMKDMLVLFIPDTATTNESIPYDQLGQAYGSIEKWLKENNRQAMAAPFEVYINDPATVKDPSEIQTDVYQPIE